MSIKGLRISILKGETTFGAKRRWVGDVDLDYAENLAKNWAIAENSNPQIGRPFTRYVIAQAGTGTDLPTILRAGTVDL